MGHYVAYVKDPRGGWFKMDDHKASLVSFSEVLKVQAYVLFISTRSQRTQELTMSSSRLNKSLTACMRTLLYTTPLDFTTAA